MTFPCDGDTRCPAALAGDDLSSLERELGVGDDGVGYDGRGSASLVTSPTSVHDAGREVLH